MSVRLADRLTRVSARFGPQLLPFADAATAELPLPRLLRLALIQVAAGLSLVLLNGVLNRVLAVEMHVPVLWVGCLVALPMLSAPLRTLVGFRSDTHRSFLGWRRTPYIWFGALLQFGGLAMTPFFLLLMAYRTGVPAAVGQIGAALGFVTVGLGLNLAQTAGLALATDLAPSGSRPRVVALLYVTLLCGMAASAFVLNRLLEPFSPLRLVQVVQSAALVTAALNLAGLWRQEAPDLEATAPERSRPSFRQAWSRFAQGGRASRMLVCAGIGGAAFGMQDVLTEPYGGQVLHMSVAATAGLTGLFSLGALGGFALAARLLPRGRDAFELAAWGALAGAPGFLLTMAAAPLGRPEILAAASAVVGFGSGLFGVSVLNAAAAMAEEGAGGLALGAWGAVQAGSAGVATLVGAGGRDLVARLAAEGTLGPGLTGPSAGYVAVYGLEIVLLFATLAALGPLVRRGRPPFIRPAARFGLAELPG